MLTTSKRNEEPRNKEGVSSTTSPSGVLALSGPPRDPSHPNHSASCPMTYMRLNTVASAADQNPTALVDGEICMAIAYLPQFRLHFYNYMSGFISAQKLKGGASSRAASIGEHPYVQGPH